MAAAMTDASNPPPESLKDRLLAFITGPQGQSLIRRALSGSGVVGVWLMHHSFPEADLGTLADIVVVALPFIVTEIWAQVGKTKAAIVTQAAKIVADRQGVAASPAGEKAAGELVKAVSTMPGVQVAVDTSAATSAVVAVAQDRAVPNVNPM